MPRYMTPDVRMATAETMLGIRVDRAAALTPQTTTQNIFTIAGGRILLTCLLGEVVVAIANTAQLLTVATLTTDMGLSVATGTPLSIASADVKQFAAGRMLTLPAAVGSALVLSVGSSAALLPLVHYVIKIGAITLQGSGSPATGTIKWSAFYFPVDEGAYMAAA